MSSWKVAGQLAWYLKHFGAAVLIAMSICTPARPMALIASADFPLVSGSTSESASSAALAVFYPFSGEIFPCVGCYPIFAQPQSGTHTFDFTRDTEDPVQFNGVISRLIDITDEVLLVGMMFFDTTGSLTGGFGGGDLEKALFGELLPSEASVELVRLIVNVHDMRFQAFGAGGAFDARLELWGEQRVGVVSEPTSGLLAAFGIFLLGATRIIRRPPMPTSFRLSRRVPQEP